MLYPQPRWQVDSDGVGNGSHLHLRFSSTPVDANVYVPCHGSSDSVLVPRLFDKHLILHDVRVPQSGRLGSGAVASLTGHSSWVLSTQISPDGKLALSGSADKTIKVWDLSTRTTVSTVQDTGEVWSVGWRPNPSGMNTSGAFVTGGEDGHLRWWRAAGTV